MKTNQLDTKMRELEIYPFWQMKEGDIFEVRFLPDLNEYNAFGFVDEFHFHRVTIDGKPRTALCSKMHEDGKMCAHCTIAKREFDKGGFKPGSRAGKLWRKQQYTANVIIIKDPLGITDPDNPKTYRIQMGVGLFREIKEELTSRRVQEIPSDYYGGYNFKITKKMYEQYPKYEGTFKRRSKLTEEQIKLADGAIMDLSNLRPKLYSSSCGDDLSKELMWDILGNE